MNLSFDKFSKLVEECQQVFDEWDTQIKEFISIAREVTRKRNEKFIPVKVDACHLQLQERVGYVLMFRTQHEQLVSTIDKVVRSEQVGPGKRDESAGELVDESALHQVKIAIDVIKNIPILDVSHGTSYPIIANF